MMSSSLSPPANTPETGYSPVVDDFSYRPVTPFAPTSIVLGMLSIFGLYSLFGIFIGLIGILLALLALLKIKASEGEVRGFVPALIGLGLSTLMFAGGIGLLAYNYATEVPEGFQRVNFPLDIAKKEFVITNGARKLHPDVEPLLGKPLFLKGFMYQTMQTEGLSSFTLLKDNGECCFGGQPKPFDMIKVTMADGKTTRAFKDQLIYVAGVLQADPTAPAGKAVYTMEVTQLGPAKTSF